MPLPLNKTFLREDEPLAPDLAELLKVVTELASETGLHSLPQEKALNVIDAELDAATIKLFGLSPQTNDESLQTRRNELQQLHDELRGLQAQSLKPPDLPALAPIAIRWPLATTNVVLVAALIGVVLTALGTAIGWLALAGLSLSAALVLVNLPLVPSLVRLSANWTVYGVRQWRRSLALRRLQKRIARSKQEIEALTQQNNAHTLRQKRGAEWKAHAREILLQHFHYHLERAEHAALFIAEEKQAPPADASEMKAVHLNGIPKHANQSTVHVVNTNGKETS